MNGEVLRSSEASNVRLLPGPQKQFGSLKSVSLGTRMPEEIWAVVPFNRQPPSKTKRRERAKPFCLCLVKQVGCEVLGEAYFQTCTLLSLCFLVLAEIPPYLGHVW